MEARARRPASIEQDVSDAIQPARVFDSDATNSAEAMSSPAFHRGPAAASCNHLPPTCVLDSILVNFYSAQRKLLQQGASLLTVLGPPHPFVATIARPGSQSNQHPICRIIEDVMSTFGHIPVPEKLGLVFKMHATLRVSFTYPSEPAKESIGQYYLDETDHVQWLINNTSENYEYIPRWLRPTATQVTTPHAAWIDNIPWWVGLGQLSRCTSSECLQARRSGYAHRKPNPLPLRSLFRGVFAHHLRQLALRHRRRIHNRRIYRTSCHCSNI